MIESDVFKVLEGIVGRENISWDPAVLDSYVLHSLPGEDADIWLQRPVAVVLPGGVEEAQAVVQACAGHGLRCKAFATGWGVFSAPTSGNIVQLDLSRMNRIIEVDVKKRTAVLEPGACAAQLQAEAMKVGMNIRLPSAGPAASPIQAFMALDQDQKTPFYSGNDDLMSIDCLLPDGRIVRIERGGAARVFPDADAVVVRGTVKLHEWPVPERLEIKGLLFDAELQIPESIRFYLCFFPDEIARAGVSDRLEALQPGYSVKYAALSSLLYCLAPNLFEKITGTEALGSMIKKVLGNSCAVMLASSSPPELEQQERALKAIVDGASGVLVSTQDAPRITALLLACYLRSAVVPRCGRGWAAPCTFLELLTI